MDKARSERMLEKELLELERQVGVLSSQLQESSEDEDWRVIWQDGRGAPFRDRMFPLEKIEESRSKIRWLYWQENEYIRRLVENAQNYIVGEGYSFAPTDIVEKNYREEIMDFWEDWERVNNFDEKQAEIVERGELDGEIFLRWIEKQNDLKVRFLEAEDIHDPVPNTKWIFGIEYDPKDIEDVKRYAWHPGRDPEITEAEWIEAEEIDHIFWFGTKSMVRGIPPYMPIVERTEQYDSWLRDRLILNKIRARIALIRRHLGASPSDVKSFADRKSEDAKDSISREKPGERKTMFKAGTIIDTHGGTEYEFLSPKLDARDVQADGRAVLLAIATGAGQSEVMATTDASNANFSSTWVAEAPPVKNFERKQKKLKTAFEKIWHRVMLWGQEQGLISSNDDVNPEKGFSGIPVSIEPPPLITRDHHKETQSKEVMHRNRVLSRRTWAVMENLDPEKEAENVKQELNDELGLGHWNGEGKNQDNENENENGENNNGDSNNEDK